MNQEKITPKPAKAIHRTTLATIGASLLISLAICALFLRFAGSNPITAYKALFMGVFGSVYGIGEALAKAVPLILIGIGVAIGFRGGLTNLGGDGQFYWGAIASIYIAIIGHGLPLPLLAILSWLGGCIAGGLWGALAGFLKAYLNANEVITTIMLNYIATLFISFLVHGPLKEPGGYIPQTQPVPSALHLPQIISGTRAHAGLLVAIIALVIYYVFIWKTVYGYRLKATGFSSKGARYAGINTQGYNILTLFLSGAFAGLAGVVEVYGIHYRVLEGISPGYGFTAVVVALLGRFHPIGILLAALLLAALTVGSNFMQVAMGVPVSLVQIIQSLIIVFVLWGESSKRR